jgi:NAD(P)-dependent dehydrogenase (short-subunit alcohol dehydrogenase family)
MKVQNKVIVVTGGASGLGREMVLNLILRGALVAAVDVNETALQETEQLAVDQRERLSTHVIDISDKDAVSAFPEQVTAEHGAVDGIINNAGIIQPFVRVNDLDGAVIEKVMNVNFYGALYMTKAFLPHLLKRPEAHIVNISSMGGFLPVPGQTVYGASKAGVKLLTGGLRSELWNKRVGVTAVFPGAICTNLPANSGVDLAQDSEIASRIQRIIKPLAPSKAAQIIISSIERNRCRVFVGLDSIVMDLLYRMSSTGAAKLISGLMQPLLSG